MTTEYGGFTKDDVLTSFRMMRSEKYGFSIEELVEIMNQAFSKEELDQIKRQLGT